MSTLDLTLRNGLPSDVGIEKLVLGAILKNATDNLNIATEILQPADFAIDSHRIMFDKLLRMADAGEKIDRITLIRALMADGKVDAIGGVSYVTDLDNELPQIYNLDSYCEEVQRKSLLRQAIVTAHLGMGRLCEPGATLDDLDAFKAEIAGIEDNSKTRRGGFRHISEIIANADGGGPAAFLNPPVESIGIAWPWSGLNRMIGFLAPGQVVCLSAGSGVGKTTLLTQALLYAASCGNPIAVLTLEMTAAEQAKKMIAQHGQACLSDWLRGESSKPDRTKVVRATRELNEKPIFFDDRDDVTPAMLRTAIERMAIPPAVVGVDYAQLMDSGIRDKSASREQHVAHISRSIKKMAKRYGCAFVVLSQENEDGKTRESRALQQDSTFHIRLERKAGGIYHLQCPKARFAAYGHHIEMMLDGATGLFREVDGR